MIDTPEGLLQHLEDFYFKCMEVRDQRILEGNPRTIKTFEAYSAVELGMRQMILAARRELGLPTEEWEN